MPHLLEPDRVGSIIGAFYAVYNYYGPGLAESVYSGALEEELLRRRHTVVRELLVSIEYRGRHVAYQRLDLVVDDRIVIELKATEKLAMYAERQIVSYLRATKFSVGVLLHFGERATFRRYIDFPKRARPPLRGDSSNSCDSCRDSSELCPPRTLGTMNDTNATNGTNAHE
ncbi:MAG TPA: GxxExxY protein [Gemmatimonadaceae bacterium]|nr:GxxExxY protein [Gemmatimonadaceae bacterium]